MDTLCHWVNSSWYFEDQFVFIFTVKHRTAWPWRRKYLILWNVWKYLPNSVTSQKIWIFCNTTVRTSDLAFMSCLSQCVVSIHINFYENKLILTTDSTHCPLLVLLQLPMKQSPRLKFSEPTASHVHQPGGKWGDNGSSCYMVYFFFFLLVCDWVVVI
jgi:hypothetical protein